MQQHLQNKKGLVQGVFNQVFDRYDLMNDFMSFGIHRLWKKNLINMMGPSKNKSLVDVACGTGDIGKLYLDNTNINNHITCIDPNRGMVSKGKEKLKNYKNIKLIQEDVIKNNNLLIDEIINTSLFDEKKIIIIDLVSDKILEIIKELE